MLTEAALCGAVDELQGLKENVILGHLIPAGSGFHRQQSLRVRKLGTPAPLPAEMPTVDVTAATLAEVREQVEEAAAGPAAPAALTPTQALSIEAGRLPLPFRAPVRKEEAAKQDGGS